MRARYAPGRPPRHLHPQRQRHVWLSWHEHRRSQIPPVPKSRAAGEDGPFPNSSTRHIRQAIRRSRDRRTPYHSALHRNWRANRCSDRPARTEKCAGLVSYVYHRFCDCAMDSTHSFFTAFVATISDSVFGVTFVSDPMQSMRYLDMLFARSGRGSGDTWAAWLARNTIACPAVAPADGTTSSCLPGGLGRRSPIITPRPSYLSSSGMAGRRYLAPKRQPGFC